MSESNNQNTPLGDGLDEYSTFITQQLESLGGHQDLPASQAVNEQPTAPIQQNEESNIPQTSEVPSNIPLARAEAAAKRNALWLDIDPRYAELFKLHQAGVELNSGDTLVFIDFPNIRKNGIWQLDCNRIAYRSQQLRVHSENLLATGSSKFADMLGPTYQFRIQRRKKLVNNLPDGVKYVLDLTPPSEGEEAASQMAQLSLTPGIIKWWTAEGLHDVESRLVTGHDDACNCHAPRPSVHNEQDRIAGIEDYSVSVESPEIKPPTPATLFRYQSIGKEESFETPVFRNIVDYCPIRHCNNIVRLLMIIEGKEIILDSASKVWTLVALAGIFDCASVVRDRVAQWITYGNNTKFIEVLPEEALQIGFSLGLVQITHCAFRILVNELAIKEAAIPQPHHDPSRTTVFGRRLGSLDDELSNMVQHAARAFVERISSQRDELRRPDVFDHWRIGEWGILKRMENVLAQESDASWVSALESLRRLMKALPQSITEQVDKIYTTYESMDFDRASYVRPKDFQIIADTMKNLNPVQRMLCSFVYRGLGELWVHKHIFFDRVATVETDLGPPKETTFARLVFELEEALQQAADVNHSKAFDGDWALFFPTAGQPLSDLKVKSPVVDLNAMDAEIKTIVHPIAQSWLRHDIDPPLNITRHMLLTLTDNEMKFLPLWAGGHNDDTGGVFSTFLPPTEMGPNGPGPAYRTGLTVASASSSVSGSLLEDVSAIRIEGSTLAGSVDAQDSISTVCTPGHFIPDDVSMATQTLDADGSEYQEARFEVPADHQGVGALVDMMVESISDMESLQAVTDDDLTEVENEQSVSASMEESDSDDSIVIV